MVPLPKVPPATQLIVEPFWQCGQVPSLKMNGASTRSGRDGGDGAADLFDDADELVADRADGMVGLAAVVPEVRPAHAGQDNPHDGRPGREGYWQGLPPPPIRS